MDRESFFLHVLQESSVIGKLNDDCALLQCSNKLLVAMDSFVEGTHFLLHTGFYPQWISYKSLARKAFIITISDIISSGAKPKFALLAITLPKYLTKLNIREIVAGIEEVCSEYQIRLIGGDTIKGSNLCFHVTIMGELQGKYLSRDRVLCGDLLAYTSIRNGDLGSSLHALRTLLRCKTKIPNTQRGVIESANIYARFGNPLLRGNFLFKAQRYIHACMDISDGLGMEIQRLQKINGLGLSLRKSFKHSCPKHVYQSGEEYELLFSFFPKDLLALRYIAKLCRIKLHIVGQFERVKKQTLPIILWH
ncbi:thiamine-phosphate kinase [Helicobacter aurati]|uniref:Thiamine-monophosphate kinase n=1 Tax=Helicobacter aurati TaxID=137778 RepID=A0A3D8J780_9HELI|nr:thiamine-phosphate kinase [Helicobacter aurati]RDU72701.1 thiamine-phosphate kinase [Helicobacter aurati]